MRQIKVGKDGVVPILDTKKLYILEVHFRDIYNRNFMSEPHYYVCITNKDGVTSFVENSIMNKDSGFVSDSIQKCVKKSTNSMTYKNLKKRKTLSCVLILKNNIFCFYLPFDQNIFLNPNCSRTC